MRCRAARAFTCFVLLCLLPASSAMAAPPVNDNVASALTLTGSPASSAAIDTTEATFEVGESPSNAKSVWYSWTPSANGTARVSNCDVVGDGQIGIYTGSAMGSLTPVATFAGGEDNCGTADATWDFFVRADTTYRLQFYIWNGGVGTGTLTVQQLGTAPTNDDVVAPVSLTTGTRAPAVDHQFAARQTGEPVNMGAAAHSAWYSWTAPANGQAIFDNCNFAASDDAVISVYSSTGLTFGDLTHVGSDDSGCTPTSGGGRRAVAVTGGSTYYVQSAMYSQLVPSGARTGSVLATFEADPPNDNYASPRSLGNGVSGSEADDNRLATREVSEIMFGGGSNHTVWYAWTAPASGTAVFDNCSTGTPFDTVAAVLLATDGIDGPVAASNDGGCGDPGNLFSRVVFSAVQGQEYRMVVGSYGSATGDFTARISMAPMMQTQPQISGTAFVGQTLSVSNGTWAGTAPITYSYQWKRCTPTCTTNISGATSSTYVLTNDEYGKRVQVEVTATNVAGSASALTSQTLLIDRDPDGDGIGDDTDNCDAVVNVDQADNDLDAQGDACDPNDDNDAANDINDAFPLNSAETTDTDGDGTGNNADTNDDGDAALDVNDAFPLNSAETTDTDGDGTGNNADANDDGDSALDANDAFPLNPAETTDTDGDGTGNNADADDDGDGAADTSDAFPLDRSESTDTDGDRTGNAADADDDGDGVADADEATKGTNPLDTDSDDDGVLDGTDKCGTVKATTADGCPLKVTFTGTGGVNVLLGNALANVFRMGGGNDRCNGAGGNDSCFGDAGNDFCDGGAGNDTCTGGIGNDTCVAISGTDKCIGGAGSDTSNTRDGRPGDRHDGGAGRDTCRGDRTDIFIGCEVKRFT